MTAKIKTIIFDLDGTLYSNDALADEIRESAGRYISSLKNVGISKACSLIDETRKRLSLSTGMDATLSATCRELGGDIRRLHDRFAAEIKPEHHLGPDAELANLLEKLAEKFDLYLYTNNNRCLSTRILDSLGISGYFREVFTIEFSWRPKPDLSTLEDILSRTGKTPGECLFVGDRYDVDLRLPASLGCEVYLVSSKKGLVFPLESLLRRNPHFSADIH